MKKYLLIALGIFAFSGLRAQKFEFSVGANSGVFHYSGNSAVASSIINEGSSDKTTFTQDPYGSRNAYSYGADVQMQYVAKGGFIIGLQAGYDLLRSKTSITGYQPILFYLDQYFTANYLISNTGEPATGQTFLQSQFITLNPYIGYRIKIKNVNLDLMPGADIAFNINSYDKGKAVLTTDGTTYHTDLKIAGTPTDIRLKFAVAASYKRYGLDISFAQGLTNYSPKLIYYPASVPYNSNTGSYNAKAYSELLRAGIFYRLF